MKYLEWGSNVGRNPQRGTPGRILMISRYEQDLRERERDIETEYAKDPEGKEFGWGGIICCVSKCKFPYVARRVLYQV